ncbi:MAG TPA: patatin-like phospholipase family protein [Caulobacterales bacterium]|nr:patatin-like phospholipase family protein [Caulobacterales bacterium]
MRAILLAAAFALAGCATAPAPRAINLPASSAQPANDDLRLEGDVMVLAFSGGGARAAAFSLGALEGLRDMRAADGRTMLDHVRIVSGVSGGAILAAYFGQHGAAGVDTFRAAYLDKDWSGHTSPFSPLNWQRALRGGVNDRTELADWLDREVFAGGTMDQVWNGRGGQVWINATDLYNGTTFAFTPLYFSALCSDLGSVRIADAVAASMAVPIVFLPVLAAPYPDRCAPLPPWAVKAATDDAAPAGVRRTAQAFAAYRNPERQRYLHLVDGGVLDNLGLTSLALARQTADTPIGPLSPRDAVRLRRMTFLIVNAEKIRSSTWQLTPQGPNGRQVLETFADLIIEAPNRASYDQFRTVVRDWEKDVRAYRCGLLAEEVVRQRGDAGGWDCADIHFAVDMVSFSDLDPAAAAQLGAAPTKVSLPSGIIDALIAGGRDGVQKNPSVLALTR